MAGRPGRRRLDHTSPLVDLDAVFADDALIDSIAARPFTPTDDNPFTALRGPESPSAGRHRRDPIDELFSAWRQELAERPMPATPSRRRVAALLEQPTPARSRRSMRSMLSVAAAIAALLVASTTLGSKEATPDSPLWGIAQVLWPDRAESVASRSSVRDALQEARSALDAGNAKDAQLALLRATAELGNVDDVDGRDEMQQQVAALWDEATPADTPSILPTGKSSLLTASSTLSSVLTSQTTSDPLPTQAVLAAGPPAADPVVSSSASETAGSVSRPDPGTVAADPVPLHTEIPSQPGGSTSTNPSAGQSADGSASGSPTTASPSSPPATLPPPSVPIVPTTPAPTAGESSAATAPAQSAPSPTPSSSTASGTALAPPAESSAVASAAGADDRPATPTLPVTAP